MKYNLTLYGRAVQTTTAQEWNITRHATDWRRTIRAIGGFWQGDFTLTTETLRLESLVEVFNHWLGRRIVEESGLTTTWEGEIVYMRLSLGNLSFERSLDPQRWHNRVKVVWGGGETAWATDTYNSANMYGDSEYIEQGPATLTSTTAEALRDRLLGRDAWPRSWASGGLTLDASATGEATLYVQCAGYVFSMNRRFRETDISAAAISTQIGTIVGLSEFVTAGRMDTNSTQSAVVLAGTPMRLWDIVRELISMGDSSGNDWVGGVYAGRKFTYHQAESSITHNWANGRLYDKGGTRVPPTTMRPDTIVHLNEVPFITNPWASGVLDNPLNVYVDEVEFQAPDQLSLIPRPPEPAGQTLIDLTRRVIGFADKYAAFRHVVSAFRNLPAQRGLWVATDYDTSGNWEDQTNYDLLLTRTNAYFYYAGLVPYASFNGSTTYFSRADEAALSITGAEPFIHDTMDGLTLGAWVYSTDTTNQQGIIAKWGAAGSRSYSLSLRGDVASDPAYFSISDDGTNSDTVSSGSNGYTSGAWYFVVGRFNDTDTGEELAIFVNGVKATDTTTRASIDDNGSTFYVGSVNAGSILTGRISIAFLCAAAVPDDQIGALFQQSRALYGV